uniref:Tankyrase 1 binding protein 1 n=1 Tax=Mastacembelus armatus TaxID=205130 RepID=A0A7N8X8M4_9TELE
MESSIETSRTGDASKAKPTLPPKPRLTPKPFSLQKNNTIRSIHAPKAVTTTSKSTTSQTEKSEVTNVPKPTLTTPAQRPPQKTTTSESQPTPVSVQLKDQPKATKEKKTSPQGDDTLDSSVALGKSDPASQTTPTKQTPKSTPVQKEDVIQTNHKESADIVTNSQQKAKEKKGAETVTQKPEESANDSSSTANSTYEWGGTRKRLPSELTSKFESGGPPLSPLPSPSKTNTKYDVNKPVTPDPELSQTAPEPSNKESDEEAPKENYTGGGSIKRRISLLFDSSSRPEVMVKKDEPEIITGGVKERIKNWAAETSFEAPEKKPQVTLRSRSKSFDSAPAAEKTPKMPPVEAPTPETSSSQTLQPSKKIFTAKQPAETQAETSKDVVEKPLESSTDTPGESEHDKSPRAEVQLRNRSPSTAQTVSDEQDSASESGQCALKRNNVKRRSVRFGIVETDDGEPPVILGSASESSSEEETCEDQAEVGTTPSVPVYRRVFQNKGNEAQKQEEKQQKHQEFEKALKAEESAQARLKFEQERKLEEEKEKEKARQEELRLREEEKQREAERERERLKLEERERLRREEWQRERLKEEERERTRLREEEMERERQMELMRQKLKEEERERAKQKEERLKQDQEERAKERLKEERERQKLRAVEERLTHEHMGHTLKDTLRVEEINKEKQKEDEKEWVNNTASLRGEEEREREKELELMWQRQKEESRERARQAEERLRQEEWEKERLRQEAEEREREKQRKEAEERMRERERQAEEERQRRELERRMQQEKEELERIRQIEFQREVERREEEWRRLLEKERVEELERKMQEELARKRAQELEEKLRLNAEEDFASTNLQERAVDKPESYLINFDSEDLPHFPLAKTCQPTESQNNVLYDDFSVRKPVIEVEFDDFSVKPKRWGSQPKAKTQPVQSWEVDSINKDEMEALVPLHVSRQENVLSEQVAKPDSPEPTAAMGSPEEEEEKEKEVEKEEGDDDDDDDDESPGEIQLIYYKVRDEEREIVKEDEVDIEDIEEEDSEDDMEEVHSLPAFTNGKRAEWGGTESTLAQPAAPSLPRDFPYSSTDLRFVVMFCKVSQV